MSAERIILIGGPTASGKSALAMQVARRVKGSIINADAMQVYAGLPLLTAQPEAADKAEIPHLLYEVTEASEASSAGKWLAQVEEAIARVRAEGRVPVLVGGTGLYFEALRGGLAVIPEIPVEVRAEASRLYEEKGEEAFRAMLATLDAESAGKIERNDRQRLIRAYEVVAHSGKSLGAWQKEGAAARIEGEFECQLLMPEREELYANCDRRFLAMMERGAIEEVERLVARGLDPALPAMKILGVREIAGYLRGEVTRERAVALAQQMTRNYAKRQMTWFRNQWEKYAPVVIATS